MSIDFGRRCWIRTNDPLLPKQMRYQTAPISVLYLAGTIGLEPILYATKKRCITIMLRSIPYNLCVCEGSFNALKLQIAMLSLRPHLTNDKHMPAYLHRVILFAVKRHSFIFICLTNGILVGRHPTGLQIIHLLRANL